MTGPTGPGSRPHRPEDSQVIRRYPSPAPTRAGGPPPRQPPRQRPLPPPRPANRTAAPRRAAPARPNPPPTPPRPPATPRKPRFAKWLRRALVLLATLAVVAVCGTVAAAFWLDGRLSRVNALPDDGAERPAAGTGTNWLLVGSDSRQALTPEQESALSTGGDTGNGRTDTILLVHIPAFFDDGPTTVVSIPRDSYVPIPGYGSDKINAAYSEGGAPLLTRTVEAATGLRIDHYAEIGFAGFASVVDAAGGITLCLDEPVDDPLAGIDLPAGCQNLDGPAALGYVRSRATPRADLDRMIHQRRFMAALLQRATSPAAWLNPLHWPALVTSAADAVTVANGDHVWDLAQLGWALAGSVQDLTMPIASFTANGSGDVVSWDDDATRALFDALRSDGPIPAGLLPDPATATP